MNLLLWNWLGSDLFDPGFAVGRLTSEGAVFSLALVRPGTRAVAGGWIVVWVVTPPTYTGVR
jgi:hypothetical protein